MTTPTIADQVQLLGQTTVRDFEQLQDFHVFTGYSYDRFARMASAGQLGGSVQNGRTGTTLSATDLAPILLGYLDAALPQVVLYQVVALFEWFIFDLLALLMQHNPHALSSKTTNHS